MCSRSERGVSQRMYLLNADRSINSNNNFVWNVSVKSASNSIYLIFNSSNGILVLKTNIKTFIFLTISSLFLADVSSSKS